MRNDPATTVWNVLSRHPWLSLGLILALQTIFTLESRALWFSDEIRYADVYMHLKEGGKWLVLSLNGVPYPDKPPVYFWLVRLIDWIVPIGRPGVFFLSAAVSGLLFLYASHLFVRVLVRDRETAFASGLVLVSNLFFVLITHYSRMDLLFAALITASQACLFTAWTRKDVGKWPIWGLALAGVAVLVKGPLGLAFPVLTSLLFLGWRGELSKLRQRRVKQGALACLAILLAWVAGALIAEGTSFIHNIFYKQIYERAVETFHHKEPFQYYFIALPLAWLPWTLVLAVVPAGRLFTRAHWKGLWERRKKADGWVYLWMLFLGGFVLLSLLSIKVLIYILPLFPALAALCAKRMLSMDAGQARLMRRILGGFYLLVGVGALFTRSFLPTEVDVQGLWLTLLILGGLGGVLLWRDLEPRGMLLCVALGTTAWTLPAAGITAPSLDPMMSPRKQAQVMQEYVDWGCYPAAYRVYSGLYSYYAGTVVDEVGDYPALERILAEHPRVVVGMARKYWEHWPDRPEGLRIVDEQFIAHRDYVLAVTTDRTPRGDPSAPFPEGE